MGTPAAMIIVFAADNPGGANMLACLMAPARARDHELVLRPIGTAAKLWQTPDTPGLPERLDVVVTGTGFPDYERLLWREAKARGIPSIGVVDAWTNPALRFRMVAGGESWPDVVAVPDALLAEELRAIAPADTRVEAVGQPHLELVVASLKAARTPHQGTRLAWISEPVAEDWPNNVRGFDQYQVFAALAEAWPTDVELVICPHPRDDRARLAVLAQTCGATVATRPTVEVLPEVDGVIGMTSMVLVEAALAGIPALSLQPNRTWPCNPMVDRLCPPALEFGQVTPFLSDFLAGLSRPHQLDPATEAVMHNAADRMLDLIERVAARQFERIPS